MRRMRWLMCAFIVAGCAQGAAAADMPLLRGSNTFDVGPQVRWDGVYFGAQVGYSVAGADFTNATGSLSALITGLPFLTTTSTPLGTDDKPSAHFGGFVGYNTVWDGAVLGVEANYNHYNAQMTSTNIIGGSYLAADGNTYPYSANGTANVRVTDVGTFRVRGGWATGNFMPYGFVGLAVARAEIDRSVTATFSPPLGLPAPPAVTFGTSQTGQFAYGWTAGVGLDIALMSNFFLRAEYEYIQFGDFQQVNIHMHNARVGAAVKF